jgi:hypothetical protein
VNQFSTYFLSRVFLFLLINVCTVTGLAAQNQSTRFGISFSSDISESEIPNLIDLGFNIIELKHPISESLLQELEEYPIQFLIRSESRYLTTFEVSQNEQISQVLAPVFQEYANYSNVSGFGISSYSSDFPVELVTLLNNLLPDSLKTNFYQVGTQASSSTSTILLSDTFNEYRDSDNYLFEAPFNQNDLGLLQQMIEEEPELILMDWYWFSSASTSQSYFLEAISLAATSSENLFPVSDFDSKSNILEWPVIVLVLLWFSIGIHLRSNPTYRPLIFRYFTYHRFFVDDIMRYRERSATPGITLFIQHAYFTGLVMYILSAFFISDKGLDALYYHLPVLGVFGQNYFTIFVLTVIASLLISFVGIIWVYIPNKSMKHFSQVINLYSWIFHLDFVIVSIMLIILITQGSAIFLLILTSVHFLCWILAFVLSVIDSSKYLMTGKLAYYMRTVGICIPFLIAVLVLFLFSGYPYDILRLAITL